MLLISEALAADENEVISETGTVGFGDPADISAPEAGGMESLALNIFPLVLLFFFFYFLILRPQNKRMREHREMIDSLKKGDRVVTTGGMIGKILKVQGNDELLIDFGNDVKATVLRSYVQERPLEELKTNDNNDSEDKKQKKAKETK